MININDLCVSYCDYVASDYRVDQKVLPPVVTFLLGLSGSVLGIDIGPIHTCTYI